VTPEATPSDDHVFLIDRPPIGEFIGFIRTMAVNGQTVDRGLLAEEWRRANDQNPDRYLKAPRPPILKDYFDPALRKVVAVTKKNRSVRVQFGYEQIDVPA
jgi:hypothetical protein